MRLYLNRDFIAASYAFGKVQNQISNIPFG